MTEKCISIRQEASLLYLNDGLQIYRLSQETTKIIINERNLAIVAVYSKSSYIQNET